MSLRRTMLAAAAAAALVPAASRAEASRVVGRFPSREARTSRCPGTSTRPDPEPYSPCPRASRPSPSATSTTRASAARRRSATGSAEERGLPPRVLLQDVSSTLQVGTVAGLALNADFADYKEWGAELGYRYYFQADQPFKPYLALAAGCGS